MCESVVDPTKDGLGAVWLEGGVADEGVSGVAWVVEGGVGVEGEEVAPGGGVVGVESDGGFEVEAGVSESSQEVGVVEVRPNEGSSLEFDGGPEVSGVGEEALGVVG